ncbi:hypothetical protein [Sphingosinicella sp. CPCC 101087]|uniref:hypothetical protein n=1 Tax=Sphingosinicella sp. CPCC 101087 TaxID=2497754 RepID=UPI0013EABD77|nr:hypothetical protein [Sphingosinicella sp. CPCC 101087]
MKLWKMLKNPIALVVQGFAVGGFLFIVANPVAPLDRQPTPQQAGESILSTLEA